MGSINAENLLVAAGALVAGGASIGEAAAVLGRAEAPPGRLEVFGGPPAQPWVVVDYAHTPDALERVLAELHSIASGSITCVFGCGGDRDRGKRAAMGRAAARYAKHIVLTDDNPRSEDPVSIVADIKSGIARHPDLRVVHDRGRAIAAAVGAAGPGDVVLVAGKGHETTQTVGGEVRPFEDRASVQRALEGVS
jgi:UDP-N-acetylmuramoyl-L-alanyl-D-glutamate--2,6-diaminopimelate ligase